jgi:putative ABC transport system ATP-binding protein
VKLFSPRRDCAGQLGGGTGRLGEALAASEAVGSLDSVAGELVMNLLSAAVREQGTTVILVTHEARVAAYADREVVVRDGRVTSLTPATP